VITAMSKNLKDKILYRNQKKKKNIKKYKKIKSRKKQRRKREHLKKRDGGGRQYLPIF